MFWTDAPLKIRKQTGLRLNALMMVNGHFGRQWAQAAYRAVCHVPIQIIATWKRIAIGHRPAIMMGIAGPSIVTYPTLSLELK